MDKDLLEGHDPAKEEADDPAPADKPAVVPDPPAEPFGHVVAADEPTGR